jgi:hypothetical protein
MARTGGGALPLSGPHLGRIREVSANLSAACRLPACREGTTACSSTARFIVGPTAVHSLPRSCGPSSSPVSCGAVRRGTPTCRPFKHSRARYLTPSAASSSTRSPNPIVRKGRSCSGGSDRTARSGDGDRARIALVVTRVSQDL